MFNKAKEFCSRNKKKVIAVAIAVVVIPVALVLGVNKFKPEDEVVDEIENDDVSNENEVLDEVVEETTNEEV